MNKFYGYENEIKENKILSVQINLLNKCMSKCKSCKKYMWPNDVLPIEDVKNVLRYLKEQGCTSVFFSGGDPIIYPWFIDVIDYCVSINLEYSLITTMITNNKTLLEKIAKTAYRIHISMDAVDSNLYEYIRGVKGFDIAKDAIDYIVSIRDKSKIPVRLSSTVGVLNYKNVYDIYNFAKKYSCLVNFYYIQLWDGLKIKEEEEEKFYEQLKLIINDESLCNNCISNAEELLQKKEEQFEINECYVPKISAIINSDGSIYPCCGLFVEFREKYNDCLKYSYGNIIGKSNEELEEEFSKRLKHYPIKCEECNECLLNNVRYNRVNKNIEEILSFEKKPLFV